MMYSGAVSNVVYLSSEYKMSGAGDAYWQSLEDLQAALGMDADVDAFTTARINYLFGP